MSPPESSKRGTAQLRKWVLVAAFAVSVYAGFGALSTASGDNSTFPDIAGIWNVAAQQCPGTCTDTWTVTPATPGQADPSVYNLTTAAGFYVHDFSVGADGSSVLTETCDGCRGYSLLTLTFKSVDGQNSFTGTWQGFNPTSNAPGSPLVPGGIAPETGEEQGNSCSQGNGSAATASDSRATDTAGGCPRPTAINMVCSYQGRAFVTFGLITAQSCFVTVRDLGPLPHQNPEGVAVFRPPGLTDANPCTLTDTVSIGVTDCEVSLSPSFFSNTKVGDTLRISATFIPSDSHFIGSEGTFSFAYTPMLDQSNKNTAARIETNLMWAGVTLGGIGKGLSDAANVPTPASPILKEASGVTYSFAAVAGTLGVVYHELQTPDEPPDPHYADVFRPRIATAHLAGIGSEALQAATRTFEQTELSIDGWAGAEWNALNRSIIARDRNNRSAFVTQMLAASTDETKMAALLSSLPAELSAVEQLSSPAERNLSTTFTTSQLKLSGETQDAAIQRLDKAVGLSPSAIADLLKQAARSLPPSFANGNLFTLLKTRIATAAADATFLRKIAAIHTAMASLYR